MLTGNALKVYLRDLAVKEPEKAAKIKRYLKLKRQRDEAKRINPVGWYKPLPSQLLFHQSTARKRLATGGNRSGKTEAGVVELIYWLLGSSPYRSVPKDVRGVVSSETFDVQENTIIDKLRALAPKNGCIRLNYTRDDRRIEGPNGWAIFKSAEQGWKAFQGFSLNFFWMDEEQDEEINKHLSKRLSAGSVMQSWYTLTPEPDRSSNWTYDALYEPAMNGEQDIALFQFDLEDNRVSRGGYIDDSEIDMLIESTPVDERPAVIHGKYVKRGGLIYPMWSRKDHIHAELPVKHFLDGVQKGVYTAFCSLDWGVRNPTALLLFCEDRDGNVHLVDELYRPARDVADIKTEYRKRFSVFQPVFVVADPSIWYNHDSQDQSKAIAGQLEADQTGLPAIPLQKADNDVENGLVACRELLRVDPIKGAKLKVQPRCVSFIKEVENYTGDEWVTNPNMRNKKETPRKKNDHAMDSFRYFCMSPHRYIPPRKKSIIPASQISPVTGYLRAGA